jgi:hypothetical protein
MSGELTLTKILQSFVGNEATGIHETRISWIGDGIKERSGGYLLSHG